MAASGAMASISGNMVAEMCDMAAGGQDMSTAVVRGMGLCLYEPAWDIDTKVRMLVSMYLMEHEFHENGKE